MSAVSLLAEHLTMNTSQIFSARLPKNYLISTIHDSFKFDRANEISLFHEDWKIIMLFQLFYQGTNFSTHFKFQTLSKFHEDWLYIGPLRVFARQRLTTDNREMLGKLS
ncbi:hypothetical protein DPMN_073338 [Dreissena polymorpha]|uniref:Uncharacterized protein n=1 Tax=Dreissena polymorpha TaxID=45954 RepID=A0A9D4HAT8_DREPO|nr:hypothetical protein DPMN_073338 [Dreissena polymorpha]